MLILPNFFVFIYIYAVFLSSEDGSGLFNYYCAVDYLFCFLLASTEKYKRNYRTIKTWARMTTQGSLIGLWEVHYRIRKKK